MMILRHFIKWIVLIVLTQQAYGADTVSLYRGSCRIDTGLILKINTTTIDFLDTSGKVSRIPRYDVVGVAIYPVPHPPLSFRASTIAKRVPMVRFLTFHDGQLTPLATGWPIGYNSSNIQLLGVDGRDVLIGRDEIWAVDKVHTIQAAQSKDIVTQKSYEFVHPHAFENCPKNIVGPNTATPSRVIPSEDFTNPITIKRFQDSLQAGYAQIEDYEDGQRFYAVPQYYGNRTLMGSWAIANSRYVNVGARQANFLPLVQDELSEGPFGFQRVVRSGLYPIRWTMQPEPSVQVFYGLKADYLKLEIFADPTRALIGDKYSWSKKQLNSVDDRLVANGGMEFLFDFGYASLGFVMTMGKLGVRGGEDFHDMSYFDFRPAFGIAYNQYRVSLYVGQGGLAEKDGSQYQHRHVKLVADIPINAKWDIQGHYSTRTLEDTGQERRFDYKSSYTAFSAQINWQYDHRWQINVLPVIEQQNAAYSTSKESDETNKTHFSVSGGATVAF